mgnify:CR=1 FL=1
MEHYKNPRNYGLVDDDKYSSSRIKNPSCGDDVIIQTLIEDGKIKDIKQKATGCSISVASASVLTEIIMGKSVEEAKEIANAYLNMITDKEYNQSIDLEEAAVFSGVKKFPARIKCASIAWVAFKDTLE